MIYGLIVICPECRNILTFSEHVGGYFNLSPTICAEDGYMMKNILLDDTLVSNLLLYGVPDAPSKTTRA